ncbi:MAG TPA: NADH-quinone oxidoreductase subunit J [Thermoanaerobaculia bacterium]|nr:NADH-quinone oxidoreductase subunit J [Thermoanaerobaculia bacterium]
MELLIAHGATILFYLFAAVVVAGAVGVVALRNPMYGALCLLATFLGVAALFLLRHAEFVGVVQIFVYGGGVMVLFLFVIMLVNLHRLRETRMLASTAPLAVVVAVLLVGLLLWAVVALPGGGAGEGAAGTAALREVAGEELGNSEAVAWVLFRDHLVAFEVASLFLLVAMIGAVVLGRRR